MKKLLLPLFLVAILAGISCRETIDIKKEKEAIKALIEKERAAYIDKDLSRIQALWVQDENSRMVYMDDDGFVEYIGWDEIAESDMLLEEWKRFEKYNSEYTNLVINVYQNTALVFFHNVWSSSQSGEEEEDNDSLLNHIHLVMLGEEWKIDWKASFRLPVKDDIYDEEDEDENEEDEDEGLGEGDEIEEQQYHVKLSSQ